MEFSHQQMIQNGKLCNSRAETYLYFACGEGHKKIVKILIERGANLDLIDKGGSSGALAMHRAVFGGHQNICEALCEAGADRTIKDKAGNNAIRQLHFNNSNNNSG